MYMYKEGIEEIDMEERNRENKRRGEREREREREREMHRCSPDVVQGLSLVPVRPVGPSVVEELTLRHLGIIKFIFLLLVRTLQTNK